MLTTRRNLMAAVAVLPIVTRPVHATAAPVGVSAKLAELIDVAQDIITRHDRHYANVEEPARRRATDAIERLPHVTIAIDSPDQTYWTTANPNSVRVARSILAGRSDRGKGTRDGLRRLIAADLQRERQARAIRRRVGFAAAAVESNDYSDQTASAEWDVIRFPVVSPADLHAKIAFMCERGLFEGIDHSEQMLADAARLAGMKA